MNQTNDIEPRIIKLHMQIITLIVQLQPLYRKKKRKKRRITEEEDQEAWLAAYIQKISTLVQITFH